MKRCPVCGSKEIYECTKHYRYSGCGEEVLPKLAPGLFSGAKIRPTVCLGCGHIALFASEAARRKAKESDFWKPISGEGTLVERDAFIAKVEERVRVLERIATDDSARLRAEIDNLRDPRAP
jgi:hypothetical protein